MMEVKTRSYYDSDCKEKHCLVCSVSAQLHFILRGLPKQYSKINDSKNGIDSKYVYIPRNQKKTEMKLQGYFDHGIRKNLTTNYWEILWFSNLNGTRVGRLDVDKQLPVGKYDWKLNRRENLDQQETIQLKLSTVSAATQHTLRKHLNHE